ncbi:MAG: oligosaccharide flippase family protein [Melioribacteraceae bacterium]|nr:oligosaccharide flippase family protein [Melioribacteraceae bacterium]
MNLYNKLLQVIKDNNALIITGFGMAFLQGMNFLTGIFLARNLTPADFGKFQLLITLITSVAIIVKLGVDEGFLYYLPKLNNEKNKIKGFISYSLVIVIISSLLVGLLITTFGGIIDNYLIQKIEFSYELSLFIYYLPVFVLFTVVLGVLRGLEFFNFRASLIYYLNPFIFIIGLIIVYYISDNISLTFIYSYRIVVFLVLGFAGLCFIIVKLKNSNFQFLSFNKIKEFHKLSFALIFITLIEFIAEQPTIDLLLLANLTDGTNLGIYAVNYRIAIIMLIIYTGFNVIYTPKMAKLYANNKKEELIKLYKNCKLKMRILSSIVFFFLITFYDYYIVFFGDEYKEGKSIFIILAISFYLISFLGLNSSLMIILNSKKKEFILNLILVLLLFVAGFLLLQIYGPLGMAIANFVSFFIIFGYRNILIKNLLIKS